MNKYPWETQYCEAIQRPAFQASTDSLERIAVAESEIYDRLEDYLQGRQRLDSGEWRAIREALCTLRNVKHDIAAQVGR